ncbi:MAG: ComEA family DNA-binding protein [Anaerolineae bacterium]
MRDRSSDSQFAVALLRRNLPLLILSLIVVLAPATAAAGHFSAATSVSARAVPQRPLYALLEASQTSSPDGIYPVFRPADPASGTARQATRLLEQSYARQALVLHWYALNYLAHQPGVDPTVADEPTYLFLGGSGGYADLGFWLEDDLGQMLDKRTTHYVGGVTIGEGYFGDFEQLFPHEVGHAILQELAGWQQGALAAQVHQVTMVTDYFYAFNEGWGEHFQAVAVDHTTNSRLQARREMPLAGGEQGPYARLARELNRQCLLCPATLTLPLWYSQRESHLRYAGVKTNLFAYQPAAPDVLVQRDDPHAALLYQSVVPPDRAGSLKNSPQMLASEGVVATLFYRLVNDPFLQQSYREPAFYDPYLPPEDNVDWSHTSPQELFSPMENVYLKLFHVFARHVRLDGDLLGESPAIQMVKGYAMEYPDEAESLYDVFLDVTQGVTVEPRALRMAQDRVAGEHEAYLRDLRQRLLAGQVRVDSALPPQIWLRNPDTEVGAGVFDVYRSLPRPYHFNLNAATIVDLRTVPGVDAELARQIVQVRDKRSGFDRLEGLAGVPGMTPETMDRFRNMQSAMYVWINEGASNPEDVALSLSPVIWLLVWRLLAQLALAWVVAGLVFGVGRTLQRITATRLGLEASPTGQDHAGAKARWIVQRGGWIFIPVILPVTLFFLVQLLLIAFNSSRQVSPLIFALAVWLILVLLPAGRRAVRRRQSSGVALHHAGWALITYVAMFAALGWLAGV